MEENRELTIGYQARTGRSHECRYSPMIKLSGSWLEKYGFEIGCRINVACSDGKLVITIT